MLLFNASGQLRICFNIVPTKVKGFYHEQQWRLGGAFQQHASHILTPREV